MFCLPKSSSTGVDMFIREPRRIDVKDLAANARNLFFFSSEKKLTLE